ncbi:MAG: glycine--tRNA ligase subunit beta, partial [Nevskiales bacterium]
MAKKSSVSSVAKSDLLIELGCEDLPARYVRPLAEALRDCVRDSLDKLLGGTLEARSVARAYATPRRIAVLVEKVRPHQPDQSIERRGPALSAAYKDGKPTAAALGFAKSCGVDFDKLEKLETDKGVWLVYRSLQPGLS